MKRSSITKLVIKIGIVLMILLIGTVVVSADTNTENLILENYSVTLFNKTDGTRSVEIILEMDWADGYVGEDHENVDLIFGLYKGRRMLDIAKRSIVLTDVGFSFKATFELQNKEKPDNCKAFLLQNESHAPITSCRVIHSGDAGFSEVTVGRNIAYVLVAEDADPVQSGDEARILLLLQDGITKVFEVDRNYYKTSESNAISPDGTWAIGSGDVVVYELNQEDCIAGIEKKTLTELDTSQQFSSRGYFNGYKVKDDAFLLYYTDKNNYSSGNYRIAAAAEIQEKILLDTAYSLDNNHQIDFLMMKYTAPECYGVLTGMCKDTSATGFGVTMLIDGEEIDKNSRNFLDYDTRLLYKATENINGTVVTLTEVLPDIFIRSGDITSLSGGVVTYGSPEQQIMLSNTSVVYKMDADNIYEVGATHDIMNNDTEFYDTDGDGLYDTVLIPGEPLVQKVILNKEEAIIAKGTSEKLSATIIPDDTPNKTIIWSSSDPSIAAVSADGLVTGVKDGMATITATLEGGGRSASCLVSITGKMAYVLDTRDMIPGLSGNEALIKLFLADGTTKVFEVDRSCYKTSESNAISPDGTWNVGCGAVVIYGLNADGEIAEVEVKTPNGTDISGHLTKHGSFNGHMVDKDAFIILYLDKNSPDVDGFTVTTLSRIAGSVASGVDYWLGSDHIIDFMLIQHVPVTDVLLGTTSLTMEAGGNDILTATVYPSEANIRGLVWSSSDPSIATVTAEGLVTGIEPGTAVITVESLDGKISRECSIEVTESISDITLDKSKITLYEGDSEQIFTSVTPNSFVSQITWSSNDQWTAEVSNTGLVTAISPGTAIITARLENGKKTASCEVTVTANSIYGVITGYATTDSDYGYEVDMLVDGEQVCYESHTLLDVYMQKFYEVSLDINGAITGVVPVEPDIQLNQGEVISISGYSVEYGDAGRILHLSPDVVVYEEDTENGFIKASINRLLNKAVEFYDIDGDRLYDIVLLSN